MKHLDEEENVILDNDVAARDAQVDDNVDYAPDIEVHDDDVVQHSPPVLQRQIQSHVDGRRKRFINKPKRLIEECDIVHYAFNCAEQVENIHEPSTYTEVVVSGDRGKWIDAMQEEMQSLEKNGTWDVVRLAKQKKTICCKWTFKRKEGVVS